MLPTHTPLISYNALRRARTTIEDFVKSYFPYHGLTTEDFLTDYWDTLVFVEGAIYQMDEDNEELTAQLTRDTPYSAAAGSEGQAWSALLAVLHSLSLLDDRVQAELNQGKRYWERERRICGLLAQGTPQQPAATGLTLQLDDVHAASMSKSFDYRVLNLLMYQLRRQPYDEAQLAFLTVDEHLVDIGDDLYDYEDDVLKNSFNIFRAYVHIFGRDAQMKLVTRISHLERQHESLLAALPAAFQKQFHARHKQAAAEPGAEKWVFPNPILDEVAYRSEHGTS